MFKLCFLLLGVFALLAQCDPVPKPTLNGVTIQNLPYAEMKNGAIKGLVVDLMDKIAQKVGFDYQLHLFADGQYGNEINGRVTGMVGEVHNKKADFAVADLTITEARKSYVDFTEPFITNQLAAIILRSDAQGLTTLEDLVNQNEKSKKERIAYGSITSGATIYKLSKTTDPICKSIFDWLQANPKAMVNSMTSGLEKVNQGKYALIAESTFAEFVAGQNCNLTTLNDNRGLYKREFAIALPKGSEYLEKFNKAISELKADGSIDNLRKTYWENKCDVKKTNSVDTLNEFSANPNVDGFNV